MLSSLIPLIVLMARVQSAAVSLNGRTSHEESTKTSLVRDFTYSNQTTNASLSPRSDFEPVDIDGNLQIVFKIYQSVADGFANFNEQTVRDDLNRDFWWYALPDKMMSDMEREREEGVNWNIKGEYEGLLAVAEGTRPWLDKEGKRPISWDGAVGEMTFLKTREPPREFLWTLHRNDDDKYPIKKVSCHIAYSLQALLI